ncbi:MAG: hypothetical protein MR009_01035 [Sutterellaceae bacterium]|nr:hypothetical protein [Sutterellaceae bacterium]MDD7441492.1 hypothetical protein [Sutterellaceae bacterium]MDY2867845.1 hypothetical protein [Mesosutterella sp.]
MRKKPRNGSGNCCFPCDKAGRAGSKAESQKPKGLGFEVALGRGILTFARRCCRVLLFRGTRGARIYCCDPELGKYLKSRLTAAKDIRNFR